MKTKRRYKVILHAGGKLAAWDGRRAVTVYRGASETAMYSHVSAMEYALLTARAGEAEIEIVENGESRWIEYRDGKRIDI